MHTFLVTCCCSDLVTKSFSKAGGRVLQLGAAAEEGEEPGCSLDALRAEAEAPRAGTPRHVNDVKNWRLPAAKSTQNLCSPRTPELPSEGLVEAHLRELRPLRPVHELLPRCSRDFTAGVHGEVLAARTGIAFGSSPALFRVPGNTSAAANSSSSRPSAQGSGPGPQEAPLRLRLSTLRRSTWAGTKKAAPKNLELLLLVSKTTSQTTGFL